MSKYKGQETAPETMKYLKRKTLINQHIYVLLAAVGEYSRMKQVNLSCYDMDLKLMINAIVQGLKVNPEHIRVLGEKGIVETNTLVRCLKEFGSRLDKESTFIFYFSGHGNGESLIMSDSAIGLKGLVHYIDRIPVKNKIIILDCCSSGKAKSGAAKELKVEDSLADFVGHGTMIMASSSADEVSRMGINHNHSLFTGIVASVLMNKSLIRKGVLSLQAVENEIRAIFENWNKKYPEKYQKPVIRGNMGGTVYFQVEAYHEYRTKEIHEEYDDYILYRVKPLHASTIKRLCAFVILKRKVSLEELPLYTKRVAARLKYEDVYTTEKQEMYFKGKKVRAVWCYFGYSESDMIRSTYFAYTIWAADQETVQMYYTEKKTSRVIDGICVNDNRASYNMVKTIQEDTISREEYIEMIKKLLTGIISRAEMFIGSLREIENETMTIEKVRSAYKDWIKDIYHLYHKVTDVPVPPDEIHDWAENVLSLAGWVVDIALILEQSEKENKYDQSAQWLIHHKIQKYYELLEKVKQVGV
ncbi:MAG: caspase family protein [Clostridiales bacterium]|nr:caspase family protein [Clostridiales bacterium]MDY3747832.1 caspase family protein [Lachnospiraceae bacterium]